MWRLALVLVSFAVVPLTGCAPAVVCPEVVVEQSSGSSGAEAPVSEVSNHALHAALTQFCSAFTEGMADRRIFLRERGRQVNRNLESMSEANQALMMTLGEGLPRGDYSALVQAAEAQGVPGFECPALQRLNELAQSGDPDIEPSVEHDLARVCASAANFGLRRQIRQEFSRELDGSVAPYRPDVELELFIMLDAEVTHHQTREMFRTVAFADPGQQRYRMIQSQVREWGYPEWTCPALERLYERIAQGETDFTQDAE